jgi:hypothetical protein
MTDEQQMPAPPASSGSIAYGARAAMQDSSLAMGRDVVRALVEMVTNASDSYARLERRGAPVDGVIEIFAERLRSGDHNRIIVRDHAEGMRRDEVLVRILRAGERTSEAGDRGVQGRGAKDISFFGRARYESIREGFYAHVVIDGGSRYDELDERPAAPADYQRMGLPDNGTGTTVTLFVRRRQQSVPRHDNLARRLSRNVQLRAIMTSPARTVTLADLLRPEAPPTPLRYTPPARTMVKSVELAIPGVPEATGTLVIYRHDEPLEDDRTMDRELDRLDHRAGGRRVAQRRGRPGVLRFSGWLRCPYIRTLQDRWDDAILSGRPADDPRNPLGIIARTRAGLSRDHPFTERLATFVEGQLRPFVAAEEEAQLQQAGRVSDETRKRLRLAARDLGARMAEVLRRLEIEYRPTGGEDQAAPAPVRLRVVPPTVYLAPETQQTFSIHAWPEAWGEEQPPAWTATIVIADEEVATLSATEVQLEIDQRDPRRRRGVFMVTAGTIEDATVIDVRLGSESELVELAVATADSTGPVAPERLTFSQGSYRAHPGRPKTLVLMAPIASVNAAGTAIVRLTSTQVEIGVPDSVELELRDAGDGRRWYEHEVRCTLAGAVNGRVRASLGAEAAVCQVTVAEERGRFGFDFLPVDELPRYASQGRADWAYPKGIQTLHIFARHPSLRPYFGDHLALQESREARMLLAEIIASELALWTLAEADAKADGALSRDAHTYTSRLKEITNDFVAVAHRCLVPELVGSGS